MREADADTDVLTTILAGVFPAARHLTFHRTLEGVSTPVYRIQADGRIYYLHLAESPKASLVPEAYVHHLLAARAVHIPNVIYFDPFNIALGRSLMITSEIAGTPVDGRVAHNHRRTILMAAGRDLARINSIPVAGFGWIDRTHGEANELRAPFPTCRAFIASALDDHVRRLREVGALSGTTIQAILPLVARMQEDERRSESAWLAHGDLDTSHVFQEGGRYSGIIDFGEIRGADKLYDLGHFLLHDGERIFEQLLPYLIEGYNEVSPLPPDYERRIRCWAIVIGISSLGRLAQIRPEDFRSMPLYQWVSQKLPTLLG